LEAFTWFTSVHAYCHPNPSSLASNGIKHEDEDDMDMDEYPLGPEGDLIPEMISRGVVPLLVKALENGAYDPYSARQTRRAVDLAEVISDLLGRESRKYTVSSDTPRLTSTPPADAKSLLKAILMVYHNHMTSLIAAIQAASGPSATPPPAFDPASRSSLTRYINRRLKLVRNIMLWRSQSPVEVGQLVSRLVAEVLQPVLERTWESGGQQVAEKVSSGLA
jgi:GC-rich sequence DNA-binding factor